MTKVIDLDPTDIAKVLWEANRPDAAPLSQQEDRIRDVYERAGEAVIQYLVSRAMEDAPDRLGTLDALAEELAWKLNHPQQFSEGARDAFDMYVALVGEDRLSEEIKRAREL